MDIEEMEFREQQEALNRAKKKNLWKRVLAVAAVVAIALAVIVPQVSAQRKAKALQEQLELGEKYLDELKYEQALDAYQAAVEIDETCAEAYVGESYAYEGMEDMEAAINILLTAEEKLQDDQINVRMEELFDGQILAGREALSRSYFEEARKAYRLARKIHMDGTALQGLVGVYISWVNFLAEKPDYEQAIALLEEGIKETDSEELKELRSKLQKEQKQYEEELERIILVQPLMEEIAGYIQAENYAAVGECQSRSEYREYAENSEDGTVFDTAYGKLGIYGRFLYLGEYTGGQREGKGVWLSVDGEGTAAAASKGYWKNDMPNGEQKLEEFLNWSDSTYVSFEGVVQNGIWVGEVIYSIFYDFSDAPELTWRLFASNGKWETYGTYEDWVIVSKVLPPYTRYEDENLLFPSADTSICIFGFEP